MNENIKYLYTQYYLRKNMNLIIARSIHQNEETLSILKDMWANNLHSRIDIFQDRINTMSTLQQFLVNHRSFTHEELQQTKQQIKFISNQSKIKRIK